MIDYLLHHNLIYMVEAVDLLVDKLEDDHGGVKKDILVHEDVMQTLNYFDTVYTFLFDIFSYSSW